MSAKWTLNTEAMQIEFFNDTALIGIVCALPAYRFCWLLNNRLDMDFKRDADWDICVKTNQNISHYFSVYRYDMPMNGNKYLIYKLKSDKEALLPEVKQLDYLLMIQSATAEADATELMHHLRNITEIQLAQVIMPEQLKNLDHLLV